MKRGIDQVYSSSEAENELQPATSSLRLENKAVNSSSSVANELQMVKELPTEVLQHIFTYLPPEQLSIISQVSQLWKRLVHPVSQILMERYFPHLARVQLDKFNNSPVLLLSKTCQRFKEKYEGEGTPFSIILEALSGTRENIETNINKKLLWALFLVNGHTLPENMKKKTIRSILPIALSIAVDNGCLQTLQRLKEIHDKGGYQVRYVERKKLLKDAAFSEKIVKAMCSWSGNDNSLSFTDIDKTEVFFIALNQNNFRLAKYLFSHFPIALNTLDCLITENKIDPVNNPNYRNFFKSLRNNNKTILLDDAITHNISWIKPYVFDEQEEKMLILLVVSAIKQNNIELVNEYLSKYQLSEYVIFSFLQIDGLSEEISELLLSKLSWPYKTALFCSGSFLAIEKFFDCPEISELCKSEAFAIALIQNSQEVISLIRKSQFRDKLQLIALAFDGTLEEIQDFMNNNEISQDVLQSAWFVASSRNDQEITQYLVDSLENKVDELQNIRNIEIKTFLRAIKFGFFPNEVVSNLFLHSLFQQAVLTHFPDFAPQMLMSAVKKGNYDSLKHFINHPKIKAEHKTEALFQVVEYCDSNNDYYNIAKDLLATNQIAVADIKAALEKAQEYCLDELVIILQNHLSNSNLQTSAEANAPTFTPALNEARSNSSQTQAEDVMTLDEMPKDKPCV
ncbi:MAG: F-box protein [Proteobacteria bacterium]|nr:F-box protein [Pseudomonadota bacterium]